MAIISTKRGAGTATADPLAHLRKADPKLGRLIDRVGPYGLVVEATPDTYSALVRSIVYQQLTGKAASTIHGRLVALHPGGLLSPVALLALEDAVLRGAGLSASKTLALRDLARKTVEGLVPPLETLATMTDDEVVDALTHVRGIGRWSVQMLLMFRLGRPDVLPTADYGIKKGSHVTFGGETLPSERALETRGERWRPYRSIASWYLWRAADADAPRMKVAASRAKDPLSEDGSAMRPSARKVPAERAATKRPAPRTVSAKKEPTKGRSTETSSTAKVR